MRSPSSSTSPVCTPPRTDRPKCLSADAVHLVLDSLSKGCVLYLVRAGGWKRDRFLRDGEPKFGRLWERSPVEKLAKDPVKAIDAAQGIFNMFRKKPADQPPQQ